MDNIVIGRDYLHKDIHGNCDICGSPFPSDLWIIGTYIGEVENLDRFLLLTPFVCHGCLRVVRLIHVPIDGTYDVTDELAKLGKSK